MKGFSAANLTSGVGPDYICKRLCPLRHPPHFVFVPLSRLVDEEDPLPASLAISRALGAEARRKKPPLPDDW